MQVLLRLVEHSGPHRRSLRSRAVRLQRCGRPQADQHAATLSDCSGDPHPEDLAPVADAVESHLGSGRCPADHALGPGDDHHIAFDVVDHRCGADTPHRLEGAYRRNRELAVVPHGLLHRDQVHALLLHHTRGGRFLEHLRGPHYRGVTGPLGAVCADAGHDPVGLHESGSCDHRRQGGRGKDGIEGGAVDRPEGFAEGELHEVGRCDGGHRCRQERHDHVGRARRRVQRGGLCAQDAG
mmetsp:Transcript_120673/g.348685  ORF Transcript_120673/g.348685 Transcript_120673/m.348685 type:complete len:239 (+) Transcript_120673:584-1300(+)